MAWIDVLSITLVSMIVSVLAADWTPDFCPTPCICHRTHSKTLKKIFNSVDCQDRDLTSLNRIPEGTEALLLTGNRLNLDTLPGNTSEIKYVDLSNNQLKFHTLEALRNFLDEFSKLQGLDLSGNQLENIERTLLKNLHKLTHLNVEENNLVFISKYAFEGLINLNTLTLSNNQLSGINPTWFRNTSALRTLHLSKNNIQGVIGEDLIHLTSLITLDLSGNGLLMFDDFISQENITYKIKELSLNDNLLSEVPSAAFQLMPDLIKLSLDNNTLKSLNSYSFYMLPSIREISAANMPYLELVDQQAFVNLEHLYRVDLFQNRNLRFFHHEAFSNCSQLAALHLHTGNLNGLDEKIKSQLPKLAEISLYNNPFNCNCRAIWLKLPKDFQSVDGNRIVCNTPHHMKGATLYSITNESLQEECGPPDVFIFSAAKLQVEFGNDIAVKCRSLGGEFIHWEVERDENKILQNSSNLELYGVQHSDSGAYHCVASSLDGQKNSDSVFLTVIHSSLVLSTTAVSNNLIILTWNQTSGPLMLSYAARTNATKSIPIPATVTTYTVHNLRPSTQYTFCLQFHNRYDQSCLTAETKPEKRPDLRNIPAKKDSLESTTSSPVLLALVVILCLVLLMVISLVIYRRYRSTQNLKRKLYRRHIDEQSTENLTPSRVNRVYQPTTEPLWMDDETT